MVQNFILKEALSRIKMKEGNKEKLRMAKYFP